MVQFLVGNKLYTLQGSITKEQVAFIRQAAAKWAASLKDDEQPPEFDHAALDATINATLKTCFSLSDADIERMGFSHSFLLFRKVLTYFNHAQ